jgi:hypothetical protein
MEQEYCRSCGKPVSWGDELCWLCDEQRGLARMTQEYLEGIMWECPHCGAIFGAASAWSGPEPDYEPGVLCPECDEFISDDELQEQDNEA